MLFPPSLPQAVLSRAFRAGNGELGVLLADADAFLDACEADRIAVLGWDLWAVDHRSLPSSDEPVPSAGSWSGMIPCRGEAVPSIFASSADLADSRRQLATLDLDGIIEPRWLPHIRVNFTLAG